MKTRTTYVLLLLLATLMTVPGAWAQGPMVRHRALGHLPGTGMGLGRGMGMGIERFSEELNLTSEQLSKIKSVWFDLHKRAIEVRAKIQLAELELRELMDADTPNESQVKGKIEVIGKLRTDLRLARVEGMMSIHQVLSAEQKAKLKELRQENRAERREERPRMQRRQGLQGFRGFNNNFEFDDMELVPEAPDESEEI